MEGLKAHLLSICLLGVFLLLGKIMRVKIKILQHLFLPSSIIAGFVALAMGPFGFNVFPEWIIKSWSQLPGVLINVVFASLFLGVTLPKPKTVWSIGGPQLCFGMVMGVGQYFIAMLLTVLVLTPVFGVPHIFATIVEIGFSGGHGTAAGMTEVFNQLGFQAGSALAQMSATVGIVCAVIVGIILINIAIRKGYCTYLNEDRGIPAYKKVGLIPQPKRFSIATATVASEVIEPLTFHFAIIGIAILLGYQALELIKPLHPHLNGFPLFPLAMLGGLIVQLISDKVKISEHPMSEYYDRDTFDRIMGFSLDVLVISAIASIRLDLFLANLWPFVIIMASGIIWLVFAMVFIAPRMFPRNWFEKGITEFGMQSGVTAIGLLLLRLVDPMYKTDTAKGFGLKQMVYEPFLGGGLITAMAPFIIMGMGVWSSIFISLGIMVAFFIFAWLSGWVTMRPQLKYSEPQE
jgi:ESS family glutamate:Na+ symporter